MHTIELTDRELHIVKTLLEHKMKDIGNNKSTFWQKLKTDCKGIFDRIDNIKNPY